MIDNTVTVLGSFLFYILIMIIQNIIYLGFPYPKFDKELKEKEYIIKKGNYSEKQPGIVECSGYTSAYVYRHFGENVTGDEVYKEMQRNKCRENIVKYARMKGYSAKLRTGNITALKNTIVKDIPVIVLMRIKVGDMTTHFTTVVGYDEEYIYLVDSIKKFRNEDTAYYNRKIPIREFRKLWNIAVPRVVSNLFIEFV